MNIIKDFAASFPSLTLHAVNWLLWKKYSFSFQNYYSMQTKLTPQGAPNGKLGFTTREGTRVFLPYAQNFESLPSVGSVGSYSHQILSPLPLLLSHPVPPLIADLMWEKSSKISNSLTNYTKHLNWSLIWRKSSLEGNPLIQNNVQQDYLPELYYSYRVSPLLPKIYLLL